MFDKRNELARAAAQAFQQDLAADAVRVEEQAPPGPEGFGPRPAGEQQEGGAGLAPTAPPLVWQPQQVAADLALAKQLVQQVDKEKGIMDNALVPPAPAVAPPAEEEGQNGAEHGAAEAPAPDADAELPYEEQLAKLDLVSAGCCAVRTLPCHIQTIGHVAVYMWHARSAPEDSLPELLCVLMTIPAPLSLISNPPLQLLAYLWRVHGIDCYGGREYFDPEEPGRATAQRTVRGEKPDLELAAAKAPAAAAEGAGGAGSSPTVADAAEGAAEAGGVTGGEGEQPVEGEGEAGAAGAGVTAGACSPAADGGSDKPPSPAEAAAKEYERRVTGFWRYRIEHGDALEVPLQRKRVSGRRCAVCWHGSRLGPEGVCVWFLPPCCGVLLLGWMGSAHSTAVQA